MGMVLELIVGSYKKTCDFVGPQGNVDKISSNSMCLKFCETRSCETRGESILEVFPTTRTNQNPMNIHPGLVLCPIGEAPQAHITQVS